MRRNQYEEALFRCEDDHFEADVILETTRSAIAQLEMLLKELEGLEENDEVYRLKEDSLSAVQIAAIRRVYAHNGMDKEVIKAGDAEACSRVAAVPEPEGVHSAHHRAPEGEGEGVDRGEGGAGPGRRARAPEP